MNICLKCNRPAASHTINNIRGGQFDSHDPLTREDQYGTANTMLTEWRAATEAATHARNGPRRACDRCGYELYQTRIVNGSDTPGAPRLISVCMPRHGCRAYTPQVRPD